MAEEVGACAVGTARGWKSGKGSMYRIESGAAGARAEKHAMVCDGLRLVVRTAGTVSPRLQSQGWVGLLVAGMGQGPGLDPDAGQTSWDSNQAAKRRAQSANGAIRHVSGSREGGMAKLWVIGCDLKTQNLNYVPISGHHVPVVV